MPNKIELNWSSADVSDGTLVVGISEKPPKKWRDAFDRTAALLNHGKWQAATNARKGSLEIASVQLGDEERVRQFLEGAVLEANATLVGEDELFEASRPGDEPEQEELSADEELTERFRAFATPRAKA